LYELYALAFMTARAHGRLRWAVGVSIVVGALGALAWNGFLRDVTYRQQRTLTAASIGTLGSVLFAVWLLLLAPIAWRARWRLAAACIGVVGLFLALVRVRGVTGDLVPVLDWRFASKDELERAPDVAPAGNAGEVVPASEKVAIDWKDSPQFLGSSRDAVVLEVKLARDWEANPPRELWRHAVGPGWSSFAVAGERAITQEQRGENEAVVCYGALDGAARWVHEVEARFANEIAGTGPHATPTIAGSKVYAVGATGILVCLALESGAELWRADVLSSGGGEIPDWGYSSSPCVGDGRVVVPPGAHSHASLVAFDAETGARSWVGGDDSPSYASPSLQVLAGVPQLVILNASTLSACAPTDGRRLWSVPWDFPNPNVCQPLVLPGDRVFVSSGYGAGCGLFHVERAPDGALSAEQVWKSTALKSKFATYVHRDGFVYGLDDGILACLDVATGRRVWKDGRYGHGQLLLVDDVLLVLTEEGELVLVDATPDGFHELSRIEALAGKTWNVPAFAAPLLFVRNDEEAVCYRLPVQ
jgi:outer membrane protein assembly factor BamB